jgi:hypothetical protein
MNAVRDKSREAKESARVKFAVVPIEKSAMKRSEEMMEEIRVRATSIGGVLEEILQSTREHARY